jgi:aminoglycoside phosphotransferase (APT) family kinase protein
MSETIGRLLAVGNVAEVFECGSRVLKLYRSAVRKPTPFREAAIHATVEAMGLPVPAVWGVQEVGGRWGIVFDRVSGASFAERMQQDPSLAPECPEILARLHARIHTHPAHELGRLKLRLTRNIARTSLLDEPRKQVLLSRLADMPEGDRLCHGDFHPINVLGQTSQPMVIDWPDACRGDPSADVLQILPFIEASRRGNRRALPGCVLPHHPYIASDNCRLAALRRSGEAGGGRPQ